MPLISLSLADRAEIHIRDILEHAFGHAAESAALLVYDQRCPLARLLAGAYRNCLKGGRAIDFDASTPEAVREAIGRLDSRALVVLVQSGSFRLDAFRLRLELFRRGLMVIEHPHLGRMEPEELEAYVDSLAYDPLYFRGVGQALKSRIDTARSGLVESGGASLIFDSPFETAKLNVGDYREMKNIGGQFPIGEVFTEARELEAVHGRIRIFAFGDREYLVNRPDRPITLEIVKGRVAAAHDSTPAFDLVLERIRADEDGVVWVRELGFGLNRAFTRERGVKDVGTYERMCGIHLSLGAKHGYNKPQIDRDRSRHHVDVFAVTESVLLDGQEVYRDGAWQVNEPK
ncbi:MAG: hypothetical protein RL095_2903 [Verrucomicrobiota bacterium]|jgi:hypothetical protein